METLIVHIDPKIGKSKVKAALKMVKGIIAVTDKISKSDIENLADDVLAREMKKAEKDELISFAEGKKEFYRLKKHLVK